MRRADLVIANARIVTPSGVVDGGAAISDGKFTAVGSADTLPEAESQLRITPRVVIVHTMVGSLLGTDQLFRTKSGLESHFGIGAPTDGADLDGVIFQWMDTDRRADANLNANAFAVSIETSDGGDESRPWSPKQLDALIRLIGALCDHHGIPRRICDRADGSGLGWHVMFGAPGPWTPVAKTCPGPVRIAQLKDTVFPAVIGVTGPQAGMGIAQEDDMTEEQARQLKAIFQGLTVQGTASPEERIVPGSTVQPFPALGAPD